MARLGKRIALILGSIALILVALFGAFLILLRLSFYASRIADFHPTEFQAKSSAPFFYSVGDDLKFSDQIDPNAPTLLHVPIRFFLVSPDSQKIAVSSGSDLLVVDRNGPAIRHVADVDSEFKGYGPSPDDKKPIGQHYFRNTGFQWSRDSKSLYVIGDEFYNSQGGQLFSDKGELWRYDLDTGSMQLLISPFRAHTYFMGINSGIYFWVPSKNGCFQLEYFDGKHVTGVGQASPNPIPVDKLSPRVTESPFMSFDEFDYANFILPGKGVHLVHDQQGKIEQLEIGTRPYLSFKLGNGIEGSSYCSETRNSAFLPGDRYLLFNADNCGNYNGLLLIDTVTGQYQRTPPKTRAYITLNTDSYPHYEIAGDGIHGLLPM